MFNNFLGIKLPLNHQPRILVGSAKGKSLIVPASARPTPAIVRKSLFDILNNKYSSSDSNFLDLYAGAGTVGFEAASRGFIVTMVEKNKKAIELIRKNQQNLRLKAEIIIDDALKFWQKYERRFDIVFIDPPYQENIQEILSFILNNTKPLAENGIIIVQGPEKLELIADQAFISQKRIYGSNALWIYQTT